MAKISRNNITSTTAQKVQTYKPMREKMLRKSAEKVAGRIKAEEAYCGEEQEDV